jgi:hypothetical protein
VKVTSYKPQTGWVRVHIVYTRAGGFPNAGEAMSEMKAISFVDSNGHTLDSSGGGSALPDRLEWDLTFSLLPTAKGPFSLVFPASSGSRKTIPFEFKDLSLPH